MTTFIPLTDAADGAVHHVAVDHIVRIDDREPASVKLATGEVLVVREAFARIETLIRGRIARSERLLERTRQTQATAAGERSPSTHP